MTWKLTGAQWRYCAKVGIAAALGYLLTQGNFNQYSVYSAFTASLIVGTSVGEDLDTSANRVKGTLVGMIAAILTTLALGPNFWTVGVSVSLTALIALGAGWGVPVARVGVTIAIITLAMHDADALEYDAMRFLNTGVGIVVGLAVSFFVWPVHGRQELARTTSEVITAATNLLDGVEKGLPLRPLEGKLHDALSALVKSWRDAERERVMSRVERILGVEPGPIELAMRVGLDVLVYAMREPDGGSLEGLRLRLEELGRTVPK
ncbi:hypothetical protein BWI17_10960 [Betaproteobacteria bacterium GR16-43]|nr:hypothetical protein BWI17_10960 [Betaproteobacteria bacterium GR16-43]